MITLNDISILIVTAANSPSRLESVYRHTRQQYPANEIVIVYDNIQDTMLPVDDPNLKQITTSSRVYVSIGYNLAIKHCSKPYFVFLHDDTYTAPSFLENLIPHLSPSGFCNFVTVEPPLFGNPDTIQKPIRNFGTSAETFDNDAFTSFYWEHISALPHTSEPSPFGGFFLAGSVESFRGVGGFDEQFLPYFYEDSDLMVRLHIAGYRFVLVLNSIVYHIGSLTSRKSHDSALAHATTQNIFLKKWKTTFEYFKQYTMLGGYAYKNPNARFLVTNSNESFNRFIELLNTTNGNVEICIDGQAITQQDVDYLMQLPYILQDTNTNETYTLGNLLIKT